MLTLISPPMSNHEITHLLDRLELEHGVRILYACESGSRAWGFASPDSDFDINRNNERRCSISATSRRVREAFP